MFEKIVFLYEPQSRAAIGPYKAQPSPEQPGAFITPDAHVEFPIPDYDPATQTCTLNEEKTDWIVEWIPVVEAVPLAAPVFDLTPIKNSQAAILLARCRDSIRRDFISDSLGAPYRYSNCIL